MIKFILGCLLLTWPIAKIPQLLKNKQTHGVYFLADRRILVPKWTNFGNNLNANNKIGFAINLLLGMALIVAGIADLI